MFILEIGYADNNRRVHDKNNSCKYFQGKKKNILYHEVLTTKNFLTI